jgi:hypothetical protein
MGTIIVQRLKIAHRAVQSHEIRRSKRSGKEREQNAGRIICVD